ncbi:hypothetical protein OS493_039314, partial [Desmophyllum pertusum]
MASSRFCWMMTTVIAYQSLSLGHGMCYEGHNPLYGGPAYQYGVGYTIRPRLQWPTTWYWTDAAVKTPQWSINATYWFGTWKSTKGEVGKAVKFAVRCGFRHLDCAWVYENEAEIGESLHEVFKEGKVKREEIFITSKL